MKIVPMKEKPNTDAVEVLENMIERVKSGEIKAIAISCVTKDGGITGETSSGDNDFLLWAALMHSTNLFYDSILEANSD